MTAIAMRTRTGIVAASVLIVTSTAAMQEKGGIDKYGPYDVIEGWLKPVEDGWYLHPVSVFAESPDRIFIASTGATPKATAPPGLTTFNPKVPGAKLDHHLVVVNRNGQIVERWTQWYDRFGSPHKVTGNPYDPEKHIWFVDRSSQQVMQFTNDGTRLVMAVGERGVAGNDDSHFNLPTDIAFLPDGTFFVSDGDRNTRVVKFDRNGRCVSLGACVLAGGLVHGQAGGSASGALPDWSGVWAMQGGNVFDRSTVQPPDGRAGEPGVREFPPYTAEWEAKYRANLERVNAGTFPDPISTCGTPAGFPRLMNLPDTYEFAVTPRAVWIFTENGPNTMRIYTDGRTFPAAEDLWGTYTGASIGHWEGDTLVFTTISLKGSADNDVILDRTGLILSDAARVTTRMRKVDDMTLEAQMTIEDPKALTRPWVATKRYRKMPPDTWVWDYACAENNRNPISPSGRTLTLGPDGKPIDRVVD